jgi:UDP-glucose 4-epimerase
LRALVTGAAGFIGRHLVRRLLCHDEVTAVIETSRNLAECPCALRNVGRIQHVQTFCDVADDRSVKNVFERYDPTHVFHLGGVSIVKQGADPTLVTRTNVLGTHNLLTACRPGTRFVLASSATIYGDAVAGDAGDAGDSVAFDETCLPAPTSAYGASKVAAEALVGAYHALGAVRGVSLRLVACAGPLSTHGVVHDLLRKLKSSSPELEIIGEPPGSTKPIMHVDDAVSAFIHFGMGAGYAGPINVCPDDSITVEKIAKALMEETGVQKPVKWLGWGANWAGDNVVLRTSNQRARGFHWEPKFPKSEDAVREVARWA